MPNLIRALLVLFVFVSLSPADCRAQAGLSLAGNQRIKVDLISDHNSVQPNGKRVARVGVLMRIEKGWHTYWENSGETAVPTRVVWTLPDGWTTSELQWPAPYRFHEKGDIQTYGYTGETLLLADLFSPDVIPNDEQRITLGAKVSYLVCKQICVPGQQSAELELSFSTSRALEPSASYALFDQYSALTPKPFEELKQFTPFAEARISAAGTISAGEKETFAVLVLSGVKSPETAGLGSLESELQIFPRLLKRSMVGIPKVKVLSGRTAGTTDIIFRLPVRLIESGGEAETASGILSVSKLLLGTPQDLSFNWSVPLSTASSPLSDEIQKEAANAASFRDLGLRVKDAKGGSHPTPGSTPVAQDTGLLEALLAAFLAGLILNLMPCVLPIISIKILGFVEQAEHGRARALRNSLSFTAGILCSFFVLALILVSLRGVGISLGWGFQFQYPEFVAALLFIVFFLSLALFDFYSVNLPFMQSANRAASQLKAPLLRHFFDGVLATALSTPCTAPVLGTALVFAFTQPPYVTVLIFLTIGFGLAMPYVYFSTHPALVNRLPAPGNWMFHFRQTMGFFLLGTCAWLMFVLDDLTDRGVVWAVVLMLLLFFFLWIRKTMLESKPARGRSVIFNLIFYTALFGTGYYFYPALVAKRGQAPKGPISWVDYSPAVLDEAKSKQQPVFIDFTATWCVTCKFNEIRLIETSDVAEAIKRLNVLPVKADWTTGDEEVTAALRRYGAEGVPLYVVIPGGSGEPIVLSTLPGKASLLEAFEQAGKP